MTETLKGAGFVVWLRHLAENLPEGYQDENGFHFGSQPVSITTFRETITSSSQKEAQHCPDLMIEGIPPKAA